MTTLTSMPPETVEALINYLKIIPSNTTIHTPVEPNGTAAILEINDQKAGHWTIYIRQLPQNRKDSEG